MKTQRVERRILFLEERIQRARKAGKDTSELRKQRKQAIQYLNRLSK